jgi:hypothetical protein
MQEFSIPQKELYSIITLENELEKFKIASIKEIS